MSPRNRKFNHTLTSIPNKDIFPEIDEFDIYGGDFKIDSCLYFREIQENVIPPLSSGLQY